jgi:hypothetical protein
VRLGHLLMENRLVSRKGAKAQRNRKEDTNAEVYWNTNKR